MASVGTFCETIIFTFQDIVAADLDEVAAPLDLCPNPPSMEAVNADGCAQSQLQTVIALSAPTYTITENNATGMAPITVSRSGSNYWPVMGVQYAPRPRARQPQAAITPPITGTLEWTPGDMNSKTFTIGIINNQGYSARNKTVGLAISSSGGPLAALGCPSTTLLTIVNDDPDPPRAISFSSSTHSVNENGGTARVPSKS